MEGTLTRSNVSRAAVRVLRMRPTSGGERPIRNQPAAQKGQVRPPHEQQAATSPGGGVATQDDRVNELRGLWQQVGTQGPGVFVDGEGDAATLCRHVVGDGAVSSEDGASLDAQL